MEILLWIVLLWTVRSIRFASRYTGEIKCSQCSFVKNGSVMLSTPSTSIPTPRAMTASPTVAPGKSSQTISKTYPNYKVIVLNDDFNTFQHVAECLMKYIPGMTSDRAWELTNQVHYEGQATVWVGPQEPAELYHQQLSRAGLTMAPLEKA
jgi:ATP-dependent Clp protease adaptor protein ClpS